MKIKTINYKNIRLDANGGNGNNGTEKLLHDLNTIIGESASIEPQELLNFLPPLSELAKIEVYVESRGEGDGKLITEVIERVKRLQYLWGCGKVADLLKRQSMVPTYITHN